MSKTSKRKNLKQKLKALYKEHGKREFDTTRLESIKGKLNKQDITKAYKLIKENKGVRAIKQGIKTKISDKDIEALREALGGEQLETINTKALNKKFFFNYRGGWFFDIIVNRKPKNNTDETITKYYGVFLNGNSGWVKVYEMDEKRADVIKHIFEDFVNSCSHLEIEDNRYVNYPCKTIISDAEPGVPNSVGKVIVKKIVQKGTSHSALSRINAFASSMRKYFKDDIYVSVKEMNEFVDNWNNHQIPNIVCSRNEMMEDKELEEAYIVSCMYHNQEIDDEGESIFKENDKVRIIEKNDVFVNDKQKFGKELSNTYKIISNDKGNIKLENINDKSDVREVRTNAISRRVYDTDFNWKEYFGIDEPILNQPITYRKAVIPQQRTPEQLRRNQEEAEIYRTARSVPKARESIKINEGIEKQEFRTRAQKKREVRELNEGERNLDRMTKKKEAPEDLTMEEIYNIMTPEQKRDLAKKVIEEDREKNFDWGFIKNYSVKDFYYALDKFLNSISAEERNNLIGELMIYTKNSKINRKLNQETQNRLKDKLVKYFNDPGNRDKTQIFKNDLDAVILGEFSKNKPGKELK